MTGLHFVADGLVQWIEPAILLVKARVRCEHRLEVHMSLVICGAQEIRR